MRLHILGLPHTVSNKEYSHCAYTGKITRFPEMMKSRGYTVYHYGVEGADTHADKHIDVFSKSEWDSMRLHCLREHNPDASEDELMSESNFIGDLANVGNILYSSFNKRLSHILQDTVHEGDVVCLPFGHGHAEAIAPLQNRQIYCVESGIGYPDSFLDYRVFESYAWYHYEIGRRNMSGQDYWTVIPNYFDSRDWKFNNDPQKFVVYFGRITEIKGLNIVMEFAKYRPDLVIKLVGQGDATPFLQYPNIQYHPPIHGDERSDLLGNAQAVIMPTRYVEPFGGVTVESQLCGTPVLGASYGSFTETIVNGVTGYRCSTLGDFLAGMERIEDGELDRQRVRDTAVEKYDMFNVAKQYDDYFQQLSDIASKGWYQVRSKYGEIRRVKE
ncbi:MAG: glycosyltransferase [Betaproteobacteria bacterium]|jgi:glycosyltransferase involved in cell wall biosynthesis